ncbi:TOMM precursor leader peptide-binding protein [Embleya sp. AB8]|uniref:TOMM precursor leader peptide-binding protein n=1 Tax=Embleya sp. AB8 TaxID=3156304 RepID=UPI003C753300
MKTLTGPERPPTKATPTADPAEPWALACAELRERIHAGLATGRWGTGAGSAAPTAPAGATEASGPTGATRTAGSAASTTCTGPTSATRASGPTTAPEVTRAVGLVAPAEPAKSTRPAGSAAPVRCDVRFDVRVTALGVRNELAVTAEDFGLPEHWSVPVHLDGAAAIVGPIRPPGRIRQACARCLARRWQLLRHELVRDALELGDGVRAVGEPAVTAFGADAVAALVAAHVAGRLAHGYPEDARHPYVYRVDLTDLTVHRVRLMADAECPSCGIPRTDDPAAVPAALGRSPRRAPGEFRQRALADYDLPEDALVNPVCGVLGAGTRADPSLPTTSAVLGSTTDRVGDVLHEINWGGHADSYADSRRIGLFEGLERHAGARPRDRRPAVIAALDTLTAHGRPALDPRACGLYSASYHAHAPGAPRFDPAAPIPWVWGYSLRHRQPLLVPQILSYYHSVPADQRFVQECSSGCASGGSLTEAALFGLLELVERDAFLLAWHGRVALPEIDPQTSTRPRTRAMVDRLALYGYRARFFDTRISFPIPVITGVAVRTTGGLGAVCFGAGAGFDPEDALGGALVEIATDALRLRARTAWDEPRLRALSRDFGLVRKLHDHPMLYGLPDMLRHTGFLLDGPPSAPRPLADLAPAAGPARTADLADVLAHAVDLLSGADFDPIVVDQTGPEQRRLGLHTASVIVPGLLPIDFGWHRQRARHLPRTRTALREAGLRDTDLDPADLNPAPHPFP